MDSNDLNTMLSFILTSFSSDFPLIKSVMYKLDELDLNDKKTYKAYLSDIDEDFLEPKFIIPIKNKLQSMYELVNRDDNVIINTGQFQLHELFAIQLASQYIQSMSSYYTPTKPFVQADNNGEYIPINKDCILYITALRVVDPNAIPESIYSVLSTYAGYKLSDFIINRSLASTLDLNNKIFEVMYNNIASDMTSSGGSEGIASVSLGGLSVSFDNKIQAYASTLGSLAQQTTSASFLSEMDKNRLKAQKAFRRKKNIFYN
jgi:hypothetical protein